MAFTAGLHVVCAPVVNVNSAPILGGPAWSETLAAAGTTTRSVPTGSSLFCFEIRAAADSYVARGVNPNAGAAAGDGDSARILVPAGETRNIACFPGDKLAWVLA